MRKFKIFIVIIGVLLLLVGGGLLAVSIVKADSNKEELKSITTEVKESFTDLSVNVDQANVEIKKSTDSVCKVEAQETEKLHYVIEVKSGKLTITDNDTRDWYEKYFFNFRFFNVKVTVYIPFDEFNNINIKSSTGSVIIHDSFKYNTLSIESTTGRIEFYNAIVAGDIKLKSSTGSISVNNVKSANLEANSSTGEIGLKNYIASNSFKLETSTGGISFEECDAKSIIVKSHTGGVHGILLTPKKFNCTSSTGGINVPNSDDTAEGTCVISTSTGGIHVSIAA